MQLMQLRYFILAAECKNMSKAALLAYTSQSNMSKQMLQLEQELEVPLFSRGNAGIDLTEAGKLFYREIKPLLARLDKAIQEVRKTGEDTCIRLSICSSLDIERGCPQFLQKIRRQTAQEVHIESDDFNRIIDKLILGEIDAGIVFSNFSTTAAGLQRRPLNRLNPLLYYSVRHPLADKDGLCLDDFRDETFVIMQSSFVTHNLISALRFTPGKIYSTNSLNAMYSYINSGTAVAVLGQNQICLGNSGIRTIEIPTETEKPGIDILWNKDRETPYLLDFLAAINRVYGIER